MTNIIGFPGYKLSDDKKSVIGRYGKPLKPNKKNCVLMRNDKDERKLHSVYKIIYCANNNISPDSVTKDFCFRMLENGEVVAENFSDRMREVALKRAAANKINARRLQHMEKYVNILKNILAGNANARLKLFSFINQDRNDYFNYALGLDGGTTRENAEMVTDKAIIDTLDTICEQLRMVYNLKGYVKNAIRRYINNSKRTTNIDSFNNFY